jgi:uncharacterized protein (TIGR02145 family)
MKTIDIRYAVLIFTLVFQCLLSTAQVKTAEIPFGTAVIDGIIEDAWDISPEQAITKPYRTETPTVTAYWKAMYDDNNFYVVVKVIDQGNHWPAWESGGESWQYDKPEVYWDWNDELADGVGTQTYGSGHYQLAEGFLEGMYNVTITTSPHSEYGGPGGTFCYSLSGEDYIYEMSIPFANFYDKDGVQITKEIALAKATIGFDVTIIDQDEGITTSRQRMVWQNDGLVNENYRNMDGAGTIKLAKELVPQKVSYQSVIRDATGELVKSSTVGMRISILQGSSSGTEAYVEIHSAGTNVNGLTTIEIGTGTPVTGTFSAIDWSNGPYFLKVENDPAGGTSYSIDGISEILSTPYSLYSQKAGSVDNETDPLFIASPAAGITATDTARWNNLSATYTEPNLSDVLTQGNDGNGYQIKNIADPTDAQDAATKAYADLLKAEIAKIKNTLIAGGGVTDADGNYYNTVKIGTQTWMAENLKTTKYNDSTDIPLVTTTWTGLTTPAYCWYNNVEATYKSTYGALYSWYVVDTASNGNKNVCPVGWHVPSDAEWISLAEYLGGVFVAGGKLKEVGITHWNEPNIAATDEIGFTALPGGSHYSSTFQFIGNMGEFWTSEQPSPYVKNRSINNDYSNLISGSVFQDYGFSIRCLKD